MFGVVFSSDGSFAFRPSEILIPSSRESIALALSTLGNEGIRATPPDDEVGPFVDGWTRLTAVDRVLDAVEILRRRGIPAQPNHVLFATCACGCGCGPHPADPRANPYYANPYYANPYYANPYYANPYYANPYYANPYYANPSAANPNPGLSRASDTEEEPRQSSAQPAEAGRDIDPNREPGPVRVTVLDTGFAGAFPPQLKVNPGSDMHDVPDTSEEDQRIDKVPVPGGDGILDPAAGHGTFIAGVIRQLTDVCDITVKRVLTTFGVGDEAQIAAELSRLPTVAGSQPHFVNLSFGGYSPYGMRPLAEEIERLIERKVVVVASAGNDATCQPMYPAAIPGVVGVAALDRHDDPASFTNFGPWVRACTLGVDVVSTFFEWNGDKVADGANDPDPDEFNGWARWSGTSFAAPRVVAALAVKFASQALNANADPYEAVKDLIDDPERIRLPMMGTFVQPPSEPGDNDVDTVGWDWVKIATKKKPPQRP